MILNARFCSDSNISDWPVVRLECDADCGTGVFKYSSSVGWRRDVSDVFWRHWFEEVTLPSLLERSRNCLSWRSLRYAVLGTGCAPLLHWYLGILGLQYWLCICFCIFYLAAFKRHYALRLAIAPEFFYCSYMCLFYVCSLGCWNKICMCVLWRDNSATLASSHVSLVFPKSPFPFKIS